MQSTEHKRPGKRSESWFATALPGRRQYGNFYQGFTVRSVPLF